MGMTKAKKTNLTSSNSVVQAEQELANADRKQHKLSNHQISAFKSNLPVHLMACFQEHELVRVPLCTPYCKHHPLSVK